MVAVGARQSLQNLSSCSLVKCRVRANDQNEKRSASSNATVGCPMKSIASLFPLPASQTKSAAVADNIRITGISTVITEIQKLGMACVDSPPSCAASGLSSVSGIRGAIQEAKMGPASAAVGIPTSSP